MLPIDFTQLDAWVNSGHFLCLYGSIGTLSIYAAQSPHGGKWQCSIEAEDCYRIHFNGDDAVEAILGAMQHFCRVNIGGIIEP